ncbi:MAG: nitroreductase family protein [Spirochaetota bacterium]|nr:nitroreductase family protein [Spirochaetota bacterium]
MSDFFDLLIIRRSIRDFEERTVPQNLIMDIIKDSCLAPSSGNGQPWKFIIVNNQDLIKRLSDDSKKNILSSIEKDPTSPSKKYEGILKDKNFNVFYNSPSLIMIVGANNHRSTYVDCTLAACYFMLSASARGLGTCWINLGADIRAHDLLEEIGLPEGHKIVAPIILGYPKEIPSIPSRKEPQILRVIT